MDHSHNVWWEINNASTETVVLFKRKDLHVYDKLVGQLNKMRSLVKEHHVGIVIDAEQLYFHAINCITMGLKANTVKKAILTICL